MQQIQDKAKKSCMVSFRQLHSYLKRLSQNDLQRSRTESGFKRVFAIIFGQDIETFTGTMFLNVEQLEKQLDKEDFQEIRSMAAFNVLKIEFQMFITLRLYLDNEYVAMIHNYFIQYTQHAILEFHDTLIQHLESVKKSVDERAQHKTKYDCWVNERQIQTTKEKVDTSKALDASLVDTESRQQHTGQLEFNNEGEVDQNAEECHDTCPLPAILTNKQIHEHSYQSLESENICLKKTVSQFQKDFSRMETHCVNFELKYQYKVLKEGKHSQFLKVKSNEAKVKHDIDVLETTNIELEHKVAKLFTKNETLKKHYKELFDSIKMTRAKTIEHITSLIATNDKFKAQLQEKGFAITALKNELRKLKGNSVNTKFPKQSIVGKSMLQSHRNQLVVRKLSAFKSDRPRILELPFASQVDVNSNLSKPVTTHYFPKEREAASAKPHHMIASSNSRIISKNMPRFSSNDMI
uniref:Integrase, catalytic region, zinc finger, CCHC-type, peptidase aspartic, catalytic n=1 Tax=Tanacetum cinerariifolium TaxID=118510 RepID=A0A699INN0_TANCI|nr:hypothetical protein [Tanacetum cinerariifolium]